MLTLFRELLFLISLFLCFFLIIHAVSKHFLVPQRRRSCSRHWFDLFQKFEFGISHSSTDSHLRCTCYLSVVMIVIGRMIMIMNQQQQILAGKRRCVETQISCLTISFNLHSHDTIKRPHSMYLTQRD